MDSTDKTFFALEPKEQIRITNNILQSLNLIDRFFFIINKLNENFEFHLDLYLLQNKIYDVTYSVELSSNHLFENFGENNYSKSLFFELEKIIRILKKRFNIGWLEESNKFSLLDSYNHLLISRYSYPYWKNLIKQEISVQLTQKRTIESIKNLIISSFEEIVYRTKLDYTWDLYQEELRSLNSFDLESAPFLSRQTTSINEDIEWVSNLTLEDVINSKIEYADINFKQDLIRVIIELIKDRRLNKKYKPEYKDEIKKFIDFISTTDNNGCRFSEYNLDFITPSSSKTFATIFYFFQTKGKITTKKTNLLKIISDSLQKGKNGFSLRNLQNIKELDFKTDSFIELKKYYLNTVL
tara:strand:- start:3383 stop:4444 length:1062 start_codon:yes stop_codon:yes gene_type:complete